jgi:hypothetical protein
VFDTDAAVTATEQLCFGPLLSRRPRHPRRPPADTGGHATPDCRPHDPLWPGPCPAKAWHCFAGSSAARPTERLCCHL